MKPRPDSIENFNETSTDSEPPISVQSHPHTIDCNEAHRDTIESPLPPTSDDFRNSPDSADTELTETVKNNIFSTPGPQRTSNMAKSHRNPLQNQIQRKRPSSQPAPKKATLTPVEGPKPENTPEKIKKATRFPLALALGSSLFVTAAGGTTGYMYLNHKGPFQNESHETNTPKENDKKDDDGYKSFANPDTAPENLETSEDLKKLLDTLAIEPAESTFELAPDNLHGKMLYLKKIDDESIEWRPLSDKVTEVEKETIVAVKIVNQAPGINVTTDGLKPLAIYHDKAKNIYYLAYSCTNQPKKSGEVYGQINVAFRGKPQTFKSIRTGRCKKKNGIDSGAQ